MAIKIIKYKIANRKRLIELLERIGFYTSLGSSDGTFVNILLPNKKWSGYQIIGKEDCRITQEIGDFHGGLTFFLKDCKFELMDYETLSISGKDNRSIFLQFHNFGYSKTKEPATPTKKGKARI